MKPDVYTGYPGASSTCHLSGASVVAPTRVLVAATDHALRALLRCALESDGHEVIEAGDGREALQRQRDTSPEIVLLDMSAPVADGLDMCRVLGTLPEGSRPAVLVVTEPDDAATIEHAFAAGAADFITKPLNWTILRRRASRLVEERRAGRRIAYLAYHDSLTGLPNRAHFAEKLERALATCTRHALCTSLLFLDLDGFKLVNDTLGHAAGDQLLETIARRLAHSVSAGDTVARLGGDEFMVLMQYAAGERDPEQVARGMMTALAEPVQVMDRDFYVTASIGIASFPDDGQDASTLLKNADTAMYRAKERGHNNVQSYTPEMGTRALIRMSLEGSLRRAVEHGDFILHYQPLVDLASGRLVALEALVRWSHADLGLVSPVHFIPLAEETGLIHGIGEWVLDRACRDAALWQASAVSPLRVAVNLSAKQFDGYALTASIEGALACSGLPPACLELEITENAVMRDIEHARAMLQELKGHGIHVSIDDFGTGHSSLGHLKRLPLDALKIDRSFVGNMPHAADDSAIVRAIVAMAHSLRLRVVAEGVESVGQIRVLRGLGCDLVQGFHVGRPMPVDAVLALLQANRSLIPGDNPWPGTASPVVVARSLSAGSG